MTRRTTQSTILAAFAASAALLLACQTPQEPKVTLAEQLRTYHQHLRWGRFQDAARYLEAGDREVFLGRHEEMGEDYKVIDFEIKNVEPSPDGQEAKVEINLQWVLEPSMTVHKDKLLQTWRLVGGAWTLTDEETKTPAPK
jgi:hypothetical protein